MNKVQIEKTDNIAIKISKGLIISFIVSLISIFIFAILLAYTNISDKIIPIVIVFLTFVSILIGSIISMRNVSKNGLVNGAIIGGIYVLLLYLISSILNTGFTFNLYTIIMTVTGIISGIIGGIIGINS